MLILTLIFNVKFKDQIDHLAELKIKASTLNSKNTKAERTAILTDVKTKSPNVKLLYITPEQAATNSFKVRTSL